MLALSVTCDVSISSSRRRQGVQRAACPPPSRRHRCTLLRAARDDARKGQEVDFDRVEKDNSGSPLTSLAVEAESARDSYADTVVADSPGDLVMKDLSYTYKRVQDDTLRAKKGLLFSKELLVWALGLGQRPQLLERLERTRAELQEADQQSFLSEVRLQYTVKRMEELEHRIKTLSDGTLRSSRKQTATAVGPVTGPPRLDVGEFPSEAWRAPHLPGPSPTHSGLYPVAHASRLLDNTLIPFDMFGRSWVTFREATGIPATVLDECSHRACPLSLGKNVGGKIQCPYHGWEYDGTGACVKMPSCHFLPGISVPAMTSVEHEGLVWVWAGSGMPALKLSSLSAPPGFRTVAEIALDVDGDARTVLTGIEEISRTDNLRLQVYKDIYEGQDATSSSSPADAFAHALARAIRSTRRQSPSTVRFVQPAAVIAENTIDFPGLGKYQLHTMHVAFPGRPGRCRLLFRMATDVSGALSFAPGMATFWEALAEELVNEELRFIDTASRRAY